MIRNYIEKVKNLYDSNRQDLYAASVIFFVGLASFGLGRLSAVWPNKSPIAVESFELRTKDREYNNLSAAVSFGTLRSQSPNLSVQGRYVASKSGTAYHYPWCPGAQRIKEENKIWFNTKEEAERNGYKPAGNCEEL